MRTASPRLRGLAEASAQDQASAGTTPSVAKPKSTSGTRELKLAKRKKLFGHYRKVPEAKVLRVPSPPITTAARAEARQKRAHWAAVQARHRSGADPYGLSDQAKAELLGRQYFEQLLADTGGAYDLDQVRVMLNGISRQAVAAKVKSGTLLAVPGPGDSRRYPFAQFGKTGQLLAGLRPLQAALPSQEPRYVLIFLTNPHDALNGARPRDLLDEGRLDLVLLAAQGMGQQGT
jgi:hypothetical protein